MGRPAETGHVATDRIGTSPTITVDGETSDWSEITPTSVELAQIIRLPGSDMGAIEPLDASLRIALDGEWIYVLFEVVDDFDYIPDDHGLSVATAVMFRIDDPA